MISVDDHQKKPIIVIADDLTGANEIGIILTEHEKKTFILSEQPVDKIPLEVVESGYKEIIKYTKTCYKKGVRIMVGDACMDEDLRIIKDGILNVDLKILPVGSAGLFQQFFLSGNLLDTYPCLIVCGSLNKATHAQAKKITKEYGAKNMELNLPQVFKNKDSELKKVIDTGSSILNKGCDLILSTPQNRYHPSSVMEPKKENYIATEIDRFLSVAARKIMERQKVSGLILAGGSISSAVIHHLKATGVEIKKQLAPLIPVGILKGGPFDGLPVITKTGGFGEEDVLIKAIKYLRGER